MRKRMVIVAAGAVAAVLAVASIAGVAAQTGGSPSNPVGGFIDRLAANLGIGAGELRSAIDKTKDEMVDEAVTDGRLSPEQGEALKERSLGDGLKRFGDFERRFEFKSDGAPHGDHPRLKGLLGHAPIFGGFSRAADIIDIDQATLMRELMAGKSLAQVADEHGVGRDELKQGLLDQYGQKLDGLLDQKFQFDQWRDGGRRGGMPSGAPTATPSATPAS